MPDMREIISNHPIHETSIVWEEAGFIPPAPCRNIIEVLHRLNSDDNENINKTDLISGLIHNDKKTVSGCSEYIFTDREKMYRFAGEMDIPDVKRSDIEIAEEILFRLIEEYIGDNPLFLKKSGVLGMFNSIPICIT